MFFLCANNKYILICFISLFILSCSREEDNVVMSKLLKWDLQLNDNPYSIMDSLGAIDVSNISQSERAYYNLLLTIARDKTYYDFTNDSLISKSEEYYNSNKINNNNHVRALMYQGIVRTRMGVKDSTAYLPLRKAETIFEADKNQDPQTGYMLNFYIGNTYFTNYDAKSASKYFKNALEFAQIKNNSLYTFDARMALFWSYISDCDLVNAKIYLDALSNSISELPNKAMLVLNAQSYYYKMIKDPHGALEYDKRQLNLVISEGNSVDLSKLYYSISNKYLAINQLDSAMHYGELALIAETGGYNKENFLFYKNLANIAELQGDDKLSNSYLKKALDEYQNTVTERLHNQLKEIEQRYDLSIAENKLLKSTQRSTLWALATLVVLLVLLILIFIHRKMRHSAQEKLIEMKHEARSRELEAKLLAEDANKMQWMINIYSYLSERLSTLQDSFESLSQRYVSSNPKVYEKMNSILNSTASELKDMYSEIHPDDVTFTQYTGLSIDEASSFNPNEKMMLMLLVNKASNKQIATFVNASVESVRARKSQLKRKMINAGMDTDRFFLN